MTLGGNTPSREINSGENSFIFIFKDEQNNIKINNKFIKH